MKIKHFILLTFLLSSCSEFENPGEPLSIVTRTLDEAYLEEDYNFSLQVTGGLRPYHFELGEDQTPDGLQLEKNGRIFGIASTEGNYEFTIIVSDANLSKTFQKFNLRVTEAPPAQLIVIAPDTEVREVFTVRVRVENARNLQAFRTLLKWDASTFKFVPESLRRNRSKIALLKENSEESLQVDIAILGESLSGSTRIFEFDLEPLIKPSKVKINVESELLSSEGKHSFRELILDYTYPNQYNQDQDPSEDPESDYYNERN